MSTAAVATLVAQAQANKMATTRSLAGLLSALVLLLSFLAEFRSAAFVIGKNERKVRGTERKCAEETVILVSFDGFRWDYFRQDNAPNLHRIAQSGARVVQVKNAFITKTFPNHYTLVTGLYPESHGIVANSMYDPAFREYFSLSKNNPPKWWDGAEPIWVTLRKRGYTTAAYNYPGSYVKIRGFRPNHYTNYSEDPFEQRVATGVKWLTENPRPRFIALYFEEPDTAGHKYGPDSKGTLDAVEKVDKIAGLLMSELEKANLLDVVNVIFTSDHGMAALSPDKEIYLDDCVNSSTYVRVDSSPIAAILPKGNFEDAIFRNLSTCHPKLTPYWKEDIPERLHYSRNRRIMPIILMAAEGWCIYTNRSEARQQRKTMKGDHGYDNNWSHMHPFFVATGPAFAKNVTIPVIDNVDIYPLMWRILNQEPLPSNGTLRRAERLLKNPAAHRKCVLKSVQHHHTPAEQENARTHRFSWQTGLGALLTLSTGVILLTVWRSFVWKDSISEFITNRCILYIRIYHEQMYTKG